MMIPLVDLKEQYKNIKVEIDAAIQAVIEQTSFISGKFANEFESEFAKYIGIRHCISCANGTDALEVALKALGVEEGDEVIVPALTWISTAEAVSSVGGVPVFADVEADFYTIDPVSINAKITSKTKGIIPVHLFGQVADMGKIKTLAQTHNLFILEDCAQAHSAELGGVQVGNHGDIATFSFYPGKNLGAYGDAGGIVTDNKALAEKCRLICNHGQAVKFDFQFEGRNSRMDGIQAAILNVKLKYLSEWTNQRRAIAELYDKELEHVIPPSVRKNTKHVYHLFVVHCEDKRDALKAFLLENGIQTAIHYPQILPLTKPYQKRFSIEKGDYPQAEKATSGFLSLPMYPELGHDKVKFISQKVAEFYEKLTE